MSAEYATGTRAFGFHSPFQPNEPLMTVKRNNSALLADRSRLPTLSGPPVPFNRPIAAVPHDTPPAPTSPWVAPGQYTVKLTVDGKSLTQPLTVKMDPRVNTPPVGLAQQFTLSKQLYDGVLAAQKAQDEIARLRSA